MTSIDRGKRSKAKMIITSHARQRWEERVDMSERSYDLKTMAFKARYEGYVLKNLDKEQIGEKAYRFLKGHFKYKTNSEALRIYKKWIFVYAGKKSRTLVTIIPIADEILKEFT